MSCSSGARQGYRGRRWSASVVRDMNPLFRGRTSTARPEASAETYLRRGSGNLLLISLGHKTRRAAMHGYPGAQSRDPNKTADGQQGCGTGSQKMSSVSRSTFTLCTNPSSPHQASRIAGKRTVSVSGTVPVDRVRRSLTRARSAVVCMQALTTRSRGPDMMVGRGHLFSAPSL